MYMNIADRYVHPRQVPYVREAFQTIIREVVDAEDLDLEIDPTVVRQ
jgi:Ras GTPase-activating-like protein IQGAP2/3